MIRKILIYLNLFGFDLKKTAFVFKNLSWFYKDKALIERQLMHQKDFKISNLNPVLADKFDLGGITSGHYFHQDLLIAQKLFINNPIKHVDIASRIDGFVAHVASYREIEVFDIRSNVSRSKNIKFVQADLMNLPSNGELINCTDSISCLHAIEHFGLGRYNDTIDVEGHIKGLDNIYVMLKPAGKFYFSTPIGKQRIEFNAQRVFGLEYLIALFKNKYRIDTFSYVNDAGDLETDVVLDKESIINNFGCNYGCGIFELTKV